MTFFPCIYFCATSQMAFYPTCTNYRCLSIKETYDEILKRNENRTRFYGLLNKLFAIAKIKGIRLIVENPYSEQTFLKANFEPPTFIDIDRTRRGDFFKKPTAYWFVNCEPTYGYSFQKDKKQKAIMSAKSSSKAGVCSTERSMISPDYARNFICDFIIGKKQKITEQTLF